jgi:hypothetical protein
MRRLLLAVAVEWQWSGRGTKGREGRTRRKKELREHGAMWPLFDW